MEQTKTGLRGQCSKVLTKRSRLATEAKTKLWYSLFIQRRQQKPFCCGIYKYDTRGQHFVKAMSGGQEKNYVTLMLGLASLV